MHLRICTSLLFIIVAFPMLAHVTLLNPKGGDSYEAGDQVSIAWRVEIPHAQVDWDLYFSPDNGITWEVIVEGLDKSLLAYQWSVPDLDTDMALVRIVQDNEGYDYDAISGAFTIGDPSVLILGFSENTNIRLFPNPAATYLNIYLGSMEISQIRLLDVNGKVHLEKQLTAHSPTLTVDLGSLNSGLYLLQIQTGQGIEQRKLLIQR